MKKIIFCFLLLAACVRSNAQTEQTLAKGQQPQLSSDTKGNLRVVFGRNDSIFCATSLAGGKALAKPVLVGVVPGMHLGMARGPQLASSAGYSVITAMDKNGDIHCFVLKHSAGGSWKKQGFVNDLRLSAPEGLMNIAADKADHFYAVWLDTRVGKRNNIFFSSFTPQNGSWTKNVLAYQSPDGHVCECCRPSIAVQDNHVAIMFRNWLMGSRDLYLVRSADKGKTFDTAQKLGTGTWKLNACPMDGGGLAFKADHSVITTWKRQGVVYTAKPGENETALGNGRDCSLAMIENQPVISMGDNGTLKLKYITGNKEITVGKGSYLKSAGLNDHKILCVWEDADMIKTKVL